jgi:hypothetical protein
LIVLGIVAITLTLHQLESLVTETGELQSRVERMRVVLPPKPRIGRAEEERIAEWSKLAVERKFNWYPVFVALEKANSEDIELLEFRPDKASGRMTLRGEARSLQALVAYLKRLAELRPTSRAYLSHQKVASRDGLQVVIFEIQASM